MNTDDYRRWARHAVDWGAEYLTSLRSRPVRAQVRPGDVAAQIGAGPPETGEPMETILADFERIVPDAMTHWQHPRFFAYFPANAAPASMVAEHLVTSMAAQCMLWQTSPAATEMETAMVRWLADAFGLTEHHSGVLQDSASTGTLSAVLTMRERASGWLGNAKGLTGSPQLRIYASAENHSSVDKAVRIAGIGQDNLVKIPTRPDHGMAPEALARAIADDRLAGHVPAGVVICVGGTSIGAVDPVADCIGVAQAEGLMTHLDAAWAGSAMICPELRPIWAGIEKADSIVINPHKWLGAQFDCSVQFLRDPTDQVRTMGMRPTYLTSPVDDEIVNYSEWTVPLGRRFRALKLWFLLRAHGLEDLRQRIRNHITWARLAADRIAALPQFEIVTQPSFSLFTFAHVAGDAATRQLIELINDDGRIYLTQTSVAGRFAIRMSVGQFETTEDDVLTACDVIRELSTNR